MANTSLQCLLKKSRVNTSLAEDYLKSYAKSGFRPIGCENFNGECYDSFKNKIYLNTDVVYPLNVWKEELCTQKKYFLKLLTEVRDNTELLCQLDYMIRKWPVEENRLCLKLVEKQILYWRQFRPFLRNMDDTNRRVYEIHMSDQSSLLFFGLIPQFLHYDSLVIKATKDVAVIVHLFVTLCHNMGLTHVMAVFIEKEELRKDKYLTGTVGVITEKSDLESALDVFVGSTTSAPWKLNRIWVQECVYDEFKLALSRKCNTKGSSGDSSETNSSDNEFIIEGKRFLIDFIGNSLNVETNHHDVTVEAYRTNKELISLLKSKDYFLSLWASDISEANEIVYSIATPVVWINDYGCFHGPPKASQAIFSDLSIQKDKFVKHPHWLIKESVKKLNHILDKWKMLSYEKRKETIQNVLVVYAEQNEEVIHWIDQINQPDPYKFIDITDKKVCIGIDSIHQGVNYLMYERDYPLEAFQVLLHSNVCVLNTEQLESRQKVVLEALFHAGVPIINERNLGKPPPDSVEIEVVLYYSYLLKTRVIISNYGTIFAN